MIITFYYIPGHKRQFEQKYMIYFKLICPVSIPTPFSCPSHFSIFYTYTISYPLYIYGLDSTIKPKTHKWEHACHIYLHGSNIINLILLAVAATFLKSMWLYSPFPCVYTLHLYPFLYWQTARFEVWLSYCGQSCNPHWHARIYVACSLGVFEVNTQEWYIWVKLYLFWGTSILPSIVSGQFASHLQCVTVSFCSPFTSDCHSEWGEMEPQCSLYAIPWWLLRLNTFVIFLLAICVSSFENCLLISLTHLLTGWFGFLLFYFLSSL